MYQVHLVQILSASVACCTVVRIGKGWGVFDARDGEGEGRRVDKVLRGDSHTILHCVTLVLLALATAFWTLGKRYRSHNLLVTIASVIASCSIVGAAIAIQAILTDITATPPSRLFSLPAIPTVSDAAVPVAAAVKATVPAVPTGPATTYAIYTTYLLVGCAIAMSVVEMESVLVKLR
ncbi:hypothetical protein HDV00_006457 [Rhizophlyctis rosea]|nr:hypothetical protein HDV00_006457 [Rhizophlyctis rosea]